jgi:hypothetical protein
MTFWTLRTRHGFLPCAFLSLIVGLLLIIVIPDSGQNDCPGGF